MGTWEVKAGGRACVGVGPGEGEGEGKGGLTSARGGPPAVPEQEASTSSALICCHLQGHLVARGDYGRWPEGPAEASKSLA